MSDGRFFRMLSRRNSRAPRAVAALLLCSSVGDSIWLAQRVLERGSSTHHLHQWLMDSFVFHPRMAWFHLDEWIRWRHSCSAFEFVWGSSHRLSGRLLAFRLAWQQLLRKKRQAALLMAGLMIGSAVISSSLIVGILSIKRSRRGRSGLGRNRPPHLRIRRNIRTSERNPSIDCDDLRNADVEGVGDIQSGRVVSASVVTADERANPSVAWFALEHRENVIIGSKAKGLTWFELEKNRFSSAPKVVINKRLRMNLKWRKATNSSVGSFEIRMESNGLNGISASRKSSKWLDKDNLRVRRRPPSLRSCNRSSLATVRGQCHLHRFRLTGSRGTISSGANHRLHW